MRWEDSGESLRCKIREVTQGEIGARQRDAISWPSLVGQALPRMQRQDPRPVEKFETSLEDGTALLRGMRQLGVSNFQGCQDAAKRAQLVVDLRHTRTCREIPPPPPETLDGSHRRMRNWEGQWPEHC
jgi:hypothetical protein